MHTPSYKVLPPFPGTGTLSAKYVLTFRKARRSRRLAADPSPPSSRKILARPRSRSTAHSTTMRCLSFISASPDGVCVCVCVPRNKLALTVDAWRPSPTCRSRPGGSNLSPRIFCLFFFSPLVDVKLLSVPCRERGGKGK